MKAVARQREDGRAVDQDECWFSRFAQPRMPAGAAPGEARRLVQREPPPQEPQQAIACWGAVRQATGQRDLYLCAGQPDTGDTLLMLQRRRPVARGEKQRVWLIFWDRARGHKSKQRNRWMQQHNQAAQRQGDGRLRSCLWPGKSPWLHAMEPHWLHATRAVAEPNGELAASELKRRLCAHFDTEPDTATLL